MRNLTEFAVGGEMKFYHLKMLKKSQDYGLMFIELVDFLSQNLKNVCHSEINLTLTLSY
jgi:hypothetical protein